MDTMHSSEARKIYMQEGRTWGSHTDSQSLLSSPSSSLPGNDGSEGSFAATFGKVFEIGSGSDVCSEDAASLSVAGLSRALAAFSVGLSTFAPWAPEFVNFDLKMEFYPKSHFWAQ